MKILGEHELLRNLNQAVRGIKNRTETGMRIAGMFVQGQAMLKTPVDTGNLRASFYTRVLQKPGIFGKTIIAEVGNTARYATPVHENLEAYHKTGEAKFLEKAVIENEATILNIVANEAKL